MRSRFLFDAPGWYDDAEQPVHLRAVVNAVMQSRRIAIRYRSWRAEKQRILPAARCRHEGRAILSRRRDRWRGPLLRIARISTSRRLPTGSNGRTVRSCGLWSKSTERMEDDTHPLTITLKLTPRGLVFLKYGRPLMSVPAWWWKPAGRRPVDRDHAAETIELAASACCGSARRWKAIEPPQLRRLVGDWAQGWPTVTGRRWPETPQLVRRTRRLAVVLPIAVNAATRSAVSSASK